MKLGAKWGIVLILVSIVLALLCSCENSVTPPGPGKMHIFVFGNDYQYGKRFFYPDGTFCGYGNPLKGTVNDAYQVGLSLCALARKAGYEYEATFMLGTESRTVTDPNVTVVSNVYMEAFLSQIDSLKARVSSEDITIIYFSGHGFGEEVRQEYGTDVSQSSYYAFRRDLSSSVLYPLSDLLAKVEDLPGTKVLLGDFCNSGGFVLPGNVSVTLEEYSGIDAITLYQEYRDDICERASLFCLSAARYYEKSWEPGDGGHGYFTAALLEALGWDEASQTISTPAAMTDNFITLFNIANYVTANDDKSAQTPMTSGGSNDIILFSF